MNAALFALLVILSALDAMTTVQIIKRGGREQNAFLAKLMNAVGVEPALLVVKVVLCGFIALAWYQAWIAGPVLTGSLVAADAVFAVIVFHNIGELQKQRHGT